MLGAASALRSAQLSHIATATAVNGLVAERSWEAVAPRRTLFLDQELDFSGTALQVAKATASPSRRRRGRERVKVARRQREEILWNVTTHWLLDARCMLSACVLSLFHSVGFPTIRGQSRYCQDETISSKLLQIFTMLDAAL